MNTPNQSIDRRSQTGQLARERLIWAIKPFGFLAIVLWILTPATTDEGARIENLMLLAFILGGIYGVGFYYQNLKYYLVQRQQSGRNTRNRMPDEYYWGQVAEVRLSRKQ
jgi:hypothetical protein